MLYDKTNIGNGIKNGEIKIVYKDNMDDQYDLVEDISITAGTSDPLSINTNRDEGLVVKLKDLSIHNINESRVINLEELELLKDPKIFGNIERLNNLIQSMNEELSHLISASSDEQEIVVEEKDPDSDPNINDFLEENYVEKLINKGFSVVDMNLPDGKYKMRGSGHQVNVHDIDDVDTGYIFITTTAETGDNIRVRNLK